MTTLSHETAEALKAAGWLSSLSIYKNVVFTSDDGEAFQIDPKELLPDPSLEELIAACPKTMNGGHEECVETHQR